MWAVDQVGPLPPIPFGVSDMRSAEEDSWGREIIINYSVIIKTYIGMKKEDMERFYLFAFYLKILHLIMLVLILMLW